MKSDFFEFLRGLWQHKPIIIVMFGIGFVIFTFFVIDTYRHRKKRKLQHRTKRLH